VIDQNQASINSWAIKPLDLSCTTFLLNYVWVELHNLWPYGRRFQASTLLYKRYNPDIFLLRCMFMEIVASLDTEPARNELRELRKVSRDSCGDKSYQANIEAVLAWFDDVPGFYDSWRFNNKSAHSSLYPGPHFLTQIRLMIQIAPDDRPSASSLLAMQGLVSCQDCYCGPEPFEAASHTFI
jgi:hypothetical protein